MSTLSSYKSDNGNYQVNTYPKYLKYGFLKDFIAIESKFSKIVSVTLQLYSLIYVSILVL